MSLLNARQNKHDLKKCPLLYLNLLTLGVYHKRSLLADRRAKLHISGDVVTIMGKYAGGLHLGSTVFNSGDDQNS